SATIGAEIMRAGSREGARTHAGPSHLPCEGAKVRCRGVVRSGTLAPVARQAIPRFDLYAALGVDPSADDAAIEAAYWDLFGQYGGDAEASDDRRIVRARLAREWLTDPDRRSRYDASRARA